MANITACISVDWEGRNLDGVEALQKFNKQFADIPITHFVSAAYLARTAESSVLESIVKAMAPGIKPVDEVALHIHCWKSLYSYSGGTEYTTHPRGPEKLQYAGQSYVDDGYVVALISLQQSDINQLFDVSMQKLGPLLTELNTANQVEYKITGFRSGGWLANNNVFSVLQMNKGLVYDASAVDSLFAVRAPKHYVKNVIPMVQAIANLWGPHETPNNTVNWAATQQSGVGRLSAPYQIGSLIELPNNGMLLPAVSANDVKAFFNWALSQPANLPLYLSVGFHQESAASYINDFINVIDTFAQNRSINWVTHAACAHSLG